jgi:hypothetical protein
VNQQWEEPESEVRSLVLNLPLNDGSQMSREIQFRFLESAGGKLPCATHLVKFGKRTKIPWKKEKFFLKSFLKGFHSENTISNGNHQSWPENKGTLGKQFSA